MHSSGPSWRENTKEEVRSGKTQQTEDDQKKLRVVEPGISQETKFAQMLSSNIVNYRCSTSAVAREDTTNKSKTRGFIADVAVSGNDGIPQIVYLSWTKIIKNVKGNPFVLTESLYTIYVQPKTQYDYDHPMVKISTGQATTADRCPNHRAGCPLSPSPTFQAWTPTKKVALETYLIWV